MARPVYLDPRSFAKADALLKATLGDNALKALLKDQRECIAYDLKEGVGIYDPVIPYMRRKVTAVINTSTYKNFTGDKPTAVFTKMNFGGQVIFSSEEEVPVNLRNELIRLKAILESASTHGILYRYKSTFAFWVGGKVVSVLPPEGNFSIGGVVNTHSYAPKVECNLWPRPYRFVWRIINSVKYKRRMDVRIRNLQDITEVNDGHTWPSPIIELGYLNTMRGKVGNFLGRQRCKRNQGVFPIN